MAKNHKIRFSVSLDEKEKIIGLASEQGYSKIATFCRDMILVKPSQYEERLARIEILLRKLVDKMEVDKNGK